MARATRTAITLLGTSILVGIIAAGCGGDNNNGGNTAAGGGGTPSTGGASTAATGGSKAVGGSSAATGGSRAVGGTSAATGGSRAVGGTSAATGGAPTATGGSAATTGGAPTATGGSAAATGGAPTATGGSVAATGGAPATGGVPATGGSVTATGGAPSSQPYTGTVPSVFCRPPTSTVDLTAIPSGVSGGITIASSATGVTLSGTAFTLATNSLFQGNLFSCASGSGFSATSPDPAPNGTPYTGLTVALTNSGTAPVVVTISMEDLATKAGSTSLYDVKLTASVTVQPGTTPTTYNLRFAGTPSANTIIFTPSATDVTMDPHRFLNIGFAIGNSASTFPLSFNVTISTLVFSTT